MGEALYLQIIRSGNWSILWKFNKITATDSDSNDINIDTTFEDE